MVFYLTAEGWVSMTAERWVPHISLVFCEMWDTTTVTLQVLVLDGQFQVKVRCIPDLAKNERDVGHPGFVSDGDQTLCVRTRKKQQQVPPLRCAPVGMTILLENRIIRFRENLSS